MFDDSHCRLDYLINHVCHILSRVVIKIIEYFIRFKVYDLLGFSKVKLDRFSSTITQIVYVISKLLFMLSFNFQNRMHQPRQ